MTTMAEAQAIGLCALARQQSQGGKPGLPDIHILRVAVVQLHAEPCGWCDYPADELLRMCREFNLTRRQFDDDRWQALPARAKGDAIRLAQGHAA
jgi:hypothetical protein